MADEGIEVIRNVLKSCPTCGGTHIRAEAGKMYQTTSQDWYDPEDLKTFPVRVYCVNCGLSISRTATVEETGSREASQRLARKKAINAWNNRPESGEGREDIFRLADRIFEFFSARVYAWLETPDGQQPRHDMQACFRELFGIWVAQDADAYQALAESAPQGNPSETPNSSTVADGARELAHRLDNEALSVRWGECEGLDIDRAAALITQVLREEWEKCIEVLRAWQLRGQRGGLDALIAAIMDGKE